MPTNESLDPPPLGSWARFYLLAAGLAVVVLFALWWFTTSYNIPLPRR